MSRRQQIGLGSSSWHMAQTRLVDRCRRCSGEMMCRWPELVDCTLGMRMGSVLESSVAQGTLHWPREIGCPAQRHIPRGKALDTHSSVIGVQSVNCGMHRLTSFYLGLLVDSTAEGRWLMVARWKPHVFHTALPAPVASSIFVLAGSVNSMVG
jgi:hypothetical protein